MEKTKLDIVKLSVVTRASGEGGKNTWGSGNFRAVKLFCMIL